MPRRSSEFSAEGTVLHEVAANCLEFGLDPHDFVGLVLSADGFSFEITEERAGWIVKDLDWLRDQPGQVYVEHRVNLERWLPGDFGTLDVGIYDDEWITIFDWKFGAGQPVNVVRNGQLRIYGLGFWDNIARHHTAAAKFRFVIAQPRVAGGGGEWTCTLDELLDFGDEVRAAGLRVDDPNAPFVASEKGCFWCDLNPKNGGPGCAALEDFLLDQIGQKLGDLDDAEELGVPLAMRNRSQITPTRRYTIVKHAPMIRQWLAALHEDSQAAARAGFPDPGSKLVAGDRGDRYWEQGADDDLLGTTAAAVLIDHTGENAFTKKLKSPAQAEKDLKPRRKFAGDPEAWARLGALIRQDEGKPILVDESDPKPALRTVDDQFDDEDDVDLLK